MKPVANCVRVNETIIVRSVKFVLKILLATCRLQFQFFGLDERLLSVVTAFTLFFKGNVLSVLIWSLNLEYWLITNRTKLLINYFL